MKQNNSLPILQPRPMTRRELIFAAGAGFSGLALTALLDQDNLLAAEPQRRRANPLAAKPSMFPAKAKSVIFLFMYGGVSHVDTFDPKPDLTRHHGKPMNKGKVDVFFGNPGNLMASPYKFKKHGQCGTEVSELDPRLAQKVDDLCLLRSVYTTSTNHSPAIFQMNSGNMRPGNPSLGSWITYGLGSENENLPAYIVMYDWRGGPIGGAPNWSSGFMPAAFQGTPFRSGNVPIVDLNPPKWVDPAFAARRGRFHSEDESGASGATRGQQRSRRAHRGLRTRLPDADSRARSRGHLERARGHEEALWDRRKDYRLFRPPVPDRAAVDRTRRALHPALQRRRPPAGVVGRALWVARKPQPALRRDRQADGRLDRGPESARPVRFDAGSVGRRVRAHADLAIGHRARP